MRASLTAQNVLWLLTIWSFIYVYQIWAQTFHPSLVLSSRAMSSQTSSGSMFSRAQTLEVKEDQVMFHFYRNGRSRKDYRKPSTKFMVSLFNELQRVGNIRTRTSAANMTDVVRSFSGTIVKEASWLLNYDQPSLSELPLSKGLATDPKRKGLYPSLRSERHYS
ncbi:nodal [Biomphalaria glabrata]|nr:putative nodal [Biomphalaria glabrata]